MLILKIAGLIILILLCLILLLLAVLLFVPVRYRAEGKKYADLRGKARVSWLFGIFSVHAAYEDGLDVSVRISVSHLEGGLKRRKRKNRKRRRAGRRMESAARMRKNQTSTLLLKKMFLKIFRIKAKAFPRKSKKKSSERIRENAGKRGVCGKRS